MNNYSKEIEFIKKNFPDLAKDESMLIMDIEIAVKTIENYSFRTYDFNENIYAVVDLILNKDHLDADGLTNRARAIIGKPSIRVF